jgi:hypothetical protein
MHTPEEIKKALQDGTDAGKHDSTPGNLFRTAWPAARKEDPLNPGYYKAQALLDIEATKAPKGWDHVDA